ncbi:MAG: DUF2064 domain-containing protein [Actinomycetota bacterium]|jgi:glycosyltransferase A (GT-A) superfamily protein (DUF2064 family)|nr:DUF2064 domain-containing protein [Actinomycetota bacterium]
MELLVVAKEPVPGRVKTRLCPPCTHEEAAALAEAALADTLEACCAVGVERVVVALDGRAGPWVPPGVDLVDQGSGAFDVRLARAWSQVRGPALQIGMDTPQVTPDLLRGALDRLGLHGTDAVLGPAEDGGWWGLGLSQPDPQVVLGIPTSRADTGRRQLERLVATGRRTGLLAVLRDVDRYRDALAVAVTIPGTRFGAMVAEMGRRVA